MATGSVKTRTSASVIDMLTKSNWVKRILFLADRTALVKQAKSSIGSLLPNLTAIDLTREKEDNGRRMVFSTYPTIMNKIDALKTDDGRFYGVGHFDLIIIDEAHRSVYQKYKAIFDYFDALVVGLTATPKKNIDHNTYELFGIEDDMPTYLYELDQAVADNYLVPPKGISVPVKFLRGGIKYIDLSEKEQKEFEEKFGDPTNEEPHDISSEALNRWLFNKDTVDQVINFLMTEGLKVEGGDKLGKSIIFAKNHEHAVFIEERFNLLYPEYGGHFLRVIDNYEPKAQDLLDRFTDDIEAQLPQIALSVDMMDTGVDAPSVLNLVFFKLVRSASKYWQMVGRGTRLRPNIFGPNEDKKEFLIFDFCQNFEFFDAHPEGINGAADKPVTQKIFEAKLEVCQLIAKNQNRSEEDNQLRIAYLDSLHKSIASLDQDRFVVRKELRKVKEYTHRNRWENLTLGDCADICIHLSKLPLPEGKDELARRFDLLAIMIQLYMINGSDDSDYVKRVVHMAAYLQNLGNVPAVAKEMELLNTIQTPEYWNNRTLHTIEDMSQRFRNLVKFIVKEKQEAVYTNFKDELDKDKVSFRDAGVQYMSTQGYKDRVEKYIKSHKDHLVIYKITHNQPITEEELKQLEEILFSEEGCGTKEQYQQHYEDLSLVAFVRSILALNTEAANKAFAEFINSPEINPAQISFIQKIIQYLTINGTIDKSMLFSEPPFNEQHQDGIIGIFDDAEATRIINIIDRVNSNSEVG